MNFSLFGTCDINEGLNNKILVDTFSISCDKKQKNILNDMDFITLVCNQKGSIYDSFSYFSLTLCYNTLNEKACLLLITRKESLTQAGPTSRAIKHFCLEFDVHDKIILEREVDKDSNNYHYYIHLPEIIKKTCIILEENKTSAGDITNNSTKDISSIKPYFNHSDSDIEEFIRNIRVNLPKLKTKLSANKIKSDFKEYLEQLKINPYVVLQWISQVKSARK